MKTEVVQNQRLLATFIGEREQNSTKQRGRSTNELRRAWRIRVSLKSLTFRVLSRYDLDILIE